MIEALIAITTLCLLVPVYVYFGYPLLLWILTRGRPERTHRIEAMTPSVTLVISCYNEATVIGEKLENALALDYPKEMLEIIVVSDGSDDGTDEIVTGFAERGVSLIRQEGRLGKTMGLNLALEQAQGEFVVFSDANALYANDAIRMLVRNFADDDVGYVVGAALYTDAGQGASAHNENLYWRYEIAIKTMESRLYAVVGGDGAIYAIRRQLWEPLQREDINDFVNPLQIIAKGYRGIFEPEAKCFEETAGSFGKEVARKERIVNRSIRGLLRVKAVMNPSRVGIFALEVISHKLLRWLIPVFIIISCILSAGLAALGAWPFQLITLGFLFIVVLAFRGHSSPSKNEMNPLVSVPYYFVMVNIFATRGVIGAIRGQTQVVWDSSRVSTVGSGVVEEQSSKIHDIGSWLFVILFLIISLILGTFV